MGKELVMKISTEMFALYDEYGIYGVSEDRAVVEEAKKGMHLFRRESKVGTLAEAVFFIQNEWQTGKYSNNGIELDDLNDDNTEEA